MITSVPSTGSTSVPAGSDDAELLARVVEVTRAAGSAVLAAFSPDARPADRQQLLSAAGSTEQASASVLREGLAAVRPTAAWAGDDLATVALPPGEFWVVDAVEGLVNHVHGLPNWWVTVALVRDGEPVLAVIHQPWDDHLYTAARGAGAWRDGVALRVSPKTDLRDVIAVTGLELKPEQLDGVGEDASRDLRHEFTDPVAALLGRVLLVKVDIPVTAPMLNVAAGHADAFWQDHPVLEGVAAGALLITEAGGTVTDLQGRPWRPGAAGILAAAPGVHAAVLAALTTAQR